MPPGCVQVELAQRFVIAGALTLTLQHVDGDRRLVVFRSREHLAVLGRDRGVLVISGVITLPMVSIPSDSGVTSSSRTSFTSPANTPPCTAAPTATASSGFTSLRGSLPKKSATFFCTIGIRVWPPTRITSWMSETDRPASFSATFSGSMERATNLQPATRVWRESL